MDANNLTVISWNVRSLTTNRIADVHYYVTQHNVDVICLQETGDKHGTSLNLRGYVGYHLRASRGVRGVSTYIKKSIPSENIVPPAKEDGSESVCVRFYLEDYAVNLINL